MAQRLPVQRINTGPQALRHAQRKLKLPVYNTTVNAVAWDSTGAGASAAGAATLTWNHTLGANANCVIVGITTNTYAYNMPTVRIGSTYLKCLGISYYDPPGNRFGMLFGMMNPPTGTQTFTVTGQVNFTSANSVAYKGVSSISTPAYNNGTGTSLSLSMAGVDAGLIVQVLSSNAPSPITTYNQTSRYNIRDGNTYALVIGDGPGGVGAPFTATNPDASAWGTIGVSLQPLSVAVPTGTQFDGMGIGSAMTGYASISFSHVATAGSCVFLDIAADRDETITNVQYGGQNMTLLGSIRFPAYSGNGGIWRYVINNAPGGLSTVTATLSANAWFEATTMGFTNVGYIGALQTTSGTSSVPTQAVTVSATGQVVLESLAAYPTAFGTLTGGTNLYKFTGQNSFSLAVNTATATSTFSTGVSETGWGALSNLLSPANTSLAATATFTAEADIYHGTWFVDSDTLAATATLTAEATRNQYATSSLASTATITDAGNFAPASANISQTVTATLTSTSTRNAIVDSSLSSTASLTSGDKTNQVFTGTQILTATADSTATRNAIVNTSLASTGTLTSTATKNFNVNASLAVTATPTSAVTLAASANAVLTTATATFTGTGTRGAVGDVSQTVTSTFTPVFSRNQKLDAAQVITATRTAIESEAATGATPLALSAALTATATKNQFCDSAIQPITASGSADSIRSVFADGSLTAWAAEGLPYTFPFFLGMPYATATAVKGILGSLSFTVDFTATGTRNAGDDVTLTVTASRISAVTWFSRADIMSLAVTASPTASVGKNQFISASLGITATATAISSTNHPADSSLSATAVVSSTFNADFLIDALRPVTASLTGTGSRRQILDAPLAVTATLTDVVKWAAKFQAALAVTGTPVVIGLRDAKVNGPLVITVTSSQYMFQTEQFDIITGVVAQPTATMNISTSADSSTDITASNPAEGLRVSFADSTLDVTSEALIEAARNVYGDSRLEVWNAPEGAVNWDGLFESVLEILADLPSLLNQGFLVEVSLDLDAETTADMWIEALLDALLTAETMTLDAYGIRDQYAEALQEISVTVTNETQWDIKMHAVLVVPASVFAEGKSGQVSSNFFVFYI